MFSIVIQLGAILCLPIYFWRRLFDFVSTFPRGSKGDSSILEHPLSLTFIAFVVTAVPSYLLTKVIGKHLEDVRLMAAALAIGGVVMIAVDLAYESGHGIRILTGRLTSHIEEMRVWQAVWIGLCQILSAVFPGTSRSMVTIAGGQLAGLTRTAALEFSFFISMPTMIAATGYDFLKTFRAGKGEAAADNLGAVHFGAHEWVLLAIGFIVSFFVALAVVAWFMNWVRRRGFVPFGVYRILAGIFVWWWLAR